MSNFYDNLEYFPQKQMPEYIYKEPKYEYYSIYNSDDYLESYEISKEGEDSYIETIDYKYDDFGNVSSYCKKRKRGKNVN